MVNTPSARPVTPMSLIEHGIAQELTMSRSAATILHCALCLSIGSVLCETASGDMLANGGFEEGVVSWALVGSPEHFALDAIGGRKDAITGLFECLLQHFEDVFIVFNDPYLLHSGCLRIIRQDG